MTRTGAAVCLVTGLALLGGGAAVAGPLQSSLAPPSPLQQTTAQPAAGDLATSLPLSPAPSTDGGTGGGLPGPLGDVTDQVTGALTGQLPGPGSGDGSGASGGQGSGSGSAEGTSGSGTSGSGTSGSGQAASGTSGGTANGRTAAAPSNDQPKAGARVQSEALTACVIPTGGSPAVEFDLSVLGNDAGSPLAQTIPQVFTPCPKGAVAADDLAGVDVDVQGLVGACVRVTREVAPLQTTLVVLDQDVIKALTDAGLPLQQLVVPCPAGTQVPSTSTNPTPGADANGGGRPPASAVPGLPGRLAFTGADTVPLASLALGLLGLGAVLTAQARRLRRSASRG
ncbi:hypothetical protein [Pedococcus cremeus]|uniref:hypothetical protein n=1 Tax=Pedococcus cremeus TaxID=587636 RepID=UPI00115FBC97|nr:hypothetical protein [Pedococcus cremeus]